MPSLNQDATIYRGSSPTLLVTVLDEAGSPLDLTGMTLNYRVSASAGGQTLLVVASPSITISGAFLNLASIPLTIAQTRALPGGELHHELYRLDGATAASFMIGTLTASHSQLTQHDLVALTGTGPETDSISADLTIA
jgi:hypothetical protein